MVAQIAHAPFEPATPNQLLAAGLQRVRNHQRRDLTTRRLPGLPEQLRASRACSPSFTGVPRSAHCGPRRVFSRRPSPLSSMTGGTTERFDERTSDAAEGLRAAHLQSVAIVAELDLDDADRWAMAGAVVVGLAAQSYRTTAVLTEALAFGVANRPGERACLGSARSVQHHRPARGPGGRLAGSVLDSAARVRLLGRLLQDLDDAPQRRPALRSRGTGWG